MEIPSGNVQETLFIPLWARALAARNYPELLNDQESLRIVAETDYEFDKIDNSREYFYLAGAIRAANFDREIKEYLDVYPAASVVSIGSGLDTTFFRVDNGKLRWYDLDLPEIIALRRKYIAKTNTERVYEIPQSCFDYSWMDSLEYDRNKGMIFIAGGVFYYFEEERVNDFIKAVAERFPGARMIFDGTSKTGLRISNRYVKKTGNKGAEMYFGINNARKYFSSVSPKIRVSADYPFYSRIRIDKNWNSDTKFRMKFSDFFGMVKLVRLDFE